MATVISQRAFNRTVAEEVTSQAYYTKHYECPEWPGLASGVTIAIGYDLGQASREKIKADWSGLVSSDMLQVMISCSGITGAAAKAKCAEVRSKILIPWDAAISVFARRDVPQWTSAVLRAVPGAEKLSGDCLGVLVDIAYNRGCSFSSQDDRHREMRAIRLDVASGRLDLVPGEIKSMKRLWPGTDGLLHRCDNRIVLWKAGMIAGSDTIDAQVHPTPAHPDPEVPLNKGAARTKPPATTKTQHGTAGAIVVAGGAAAQQAHAQGLIGTPVLIFACFIAVLAGATVWLTWYRNRNPK